MCFFGTGSSVLVGEIESKPPQVSKVTIVASETLRAGIQYPYHASMRVNQRLTLTLKLTLTLIPKPIAGGVLRLSLESTCLLMPSFFLPLLDGRAALRVSALQSRVCI